VRRYSCYVFDLDGTVYRGDEVIAGAAEALRELRKSDVRILFATNNSSQTEASYVAKLSRMGIQARLDEILTSGRAAARYCAAVGIRRVFVVGEAGLAETLIDEGIGVVNFNTLRVHPVKGAVDAVIAGICRDALSYELLDSAMQCVLAGARLIGTNADATYPLAGGRFAPGAGTVLGALAACTGIKPTVIGKPNPYMLFQVLQAEGISAADTVVVGDRIDTDIMFAKAAGCTGILVATGVDKEAPVGTASIGGLLELL
jgi:4-nitrophenyl phosphatase